ncbi:hypothetical protein Poli38472_013175 [Pythium oligandrum]|uniref:PX domain-containing protein n=1 Tax=Pythium oligandrum TaxID=41045 RepID=A0A8K1C2I5_PYTOL|nr:hypothetical protein Poli38472_013175 [Pythium oligandrum]|eukprot:TMW55284.1 hypothetical protein Poli38472_013175 [Pythium oligandrum]
MLLRGFLDREYPLSNVLSRHEYRLFRGAPKVKKKKVDMTEEADHAAQLWRELVESSLECELCNEPYDESDEHLPRLLSCGHTFCQSCLDDWSSVGASTALGHARAHEVAVMECPTCRRPTQYTAVEGARSLPKNFELLRVRQEFESQTQPQLAKLKQVWTTQVLEKERLAQEAEEHAMLAQRESVEAAQRAMFLAKQVEINEQEKRRAQEVAQEARRRALVASQQAEALQAETELLKQRLHQEALQLQRVRNDASSAAAEAAELHSRAELLEQQVEYVRAQLSLHSGRHDPSKLVVLVVEPTTVGSWLLPYTRYAVISIASDAQRSMDPYLAAKTWTLNRQVAEPSASVKVYRRYSDFVWLHHELRRKFPFELVPSVPGKQLFFNKDKDFVGERMRALQAFLRQVLRHPVLAVTEDVRAFLLSTTEELEQLRNTARLNDDEDSFLKEVEESEIVSTTTSQRSSVDTLTPVSSPPSSSATSAASKRSSWAWGAVSAFTSSAAKLVTTTVSNGISGVTGSTTSLREGETTEKAMSSSLTPPDNGEGLDPQRRQSIETRRKYIEVAQAHQAVATRGSQVSRAQRRASHHLHRLCELMHNMDTLDQDYSKKQRERLAMSMDRSTYTARQVEEDARSCLESRTFQARASEVFSALSLSTKNDAECMEFALLEVSRMQTSHLGAIEDAFTRLRSKEDALQRAATSSNGASGTASSSSSYASDDFGLTSPVLALKQDELQQRRHEIQQLVQRVDPNRAAFVLDTLQKNVVEMHKLAQTRRKLFQDSQKQLRKASVV